MIVRFSPPRVFILVSFIGLLAAPVAAGSDVALPETIEISAGPFIAGSDRRERDAAYALDEAA